MTRKTPIIHFLPLCVNSISMRTIFKKERRGLVDLSSFMNVCGYAAVAQDMPEETTQLGRTDRWTRRARQRTFSCSEDITNYNWTKRAPASLWDLTGPSWTGRRMPVTRDDKRRFWRRCWWRGLSRTFISTTSSVPFRSRPYRPGHQAIRPRTHARTASWARTQTNTLLSDSPMPPSWIFSLLIPPRRHDPKPPPEMS